MYKEKNEIENLVVRKVKEGLDVEYKQELPTFSSEADKIEFLADISSFANSNGGYLFFGVKEERDASGRSTDVPEKAIGLTVTNVSAIERQMTDIINGNLEPRVHGFSCWSVDGFDLGPIMVFHVPPSWNRPHLIRGSKNPFYIRTARGKHPMSVQEIRASFLLSEAIGERIRKFHASRVAAIYAGQLPGVNSGKSALLMHLIPFSSMELGAQVDIVLPEPLRNLLYPRARYGEQRFSIDGYRGVHIDKRDGSTLAFAMLMRNGVIEIYDSFAVNSAKDNPNPVYIRPLYYEPYIVEAIPEYLLVLKGLGIAPPIFILISLMNTRGCLLQRHHSVGYPIEAETISLPEVTVQEYETMISSAMKPTFDAGWQACGFPGSENYRDGNWAPVYPGRQ